MSQLQPVGGDLQLHQRKCLTLLLCAVLDNFFTGMTWDDSYTELTVSRIQDFAVIIFSSLTRCFTRKGVSISGAQRGGGLIGAIGGRGRAADLRGSRPDVDAENRLIDQLDEEWED